MTIGAPVKHAMSLNSLLAEIGIDGTGIFADVLINTVTADSRRVGPGAIFVAISGEQRDGHDFIGQAIAKKAALVMVMRGRTGNIDRSRVSVVEVEDTRPALGRLVAALYGKPADRMTLIAITGTNGKTTTSWLLESMVTAAGGVPGVIGTVNYRYPGSVRTASLTTPGPEELQPLFVAMAAAGVTHVIMETSSHALQQHRLEGLQFTVGLFTNLTRDHLDYHGDMESYYQSKKLLFTDYLTEDGKAVVVLEDVTEQNGQGRRLAGELVGVHGFGSNRVLTCGIDDGDVRVTKSSTDLGGTIAEVTTPAGEMSLKSPLVGRFNLRNLIGAAAVGVALKMSDKAIISGLAAVHGVPGRLEKIACGSAASVFVDYAHTPDALANVLGALRELVPERLVVVFGCGGDRDPGKRPMMGEIAGRMADCVLITSDNPRSEDPVIILEGIEQGLAGLNLTRMRAEAFLARNWKRCYDVVESRREAIRLAVGLAQKGDAVLVSGKGHECYQLIGGRSISFDDRLEAKYAGQAIC